jgi:hypothetical protein
MSIPEGFQVDQRVGIAMGAHSASQKAALKPLLQNEERFVRLPASEGSRKACSRSSIVLRPTPGESNRRVRETTSQLGNFSQPTWYGA